MSRPETPTDPYCNRTADAIPGLVTAAKDEGESPSDFAMQDGTYNPTTNEFCCDDCYVSLGAPTSSGGWVAGDPIPS